MCLCIYVLSDRELSTPIDPIRYPNLNLTLVDREHGRLILDGIRKVAPATYVYSLSPGSYCGCYFNYENATKLHLQLADQVVNPDRYACSAEESKAMWECRVNSVKAFGRYLADHFDLNLSVYVVWEHREGQKEPKIAEIPPSYFDGPSFVALPEDLLLTIVPERTDDSRWPWNPNQKRTHNWLELSYFDDEDEDCMVSA